jgi:hypothetical protein
VDHEAVDNGQVPDVLVVFPDGRRFAFEIQYAPLTIDAWRARHAGYRAQDIVDIWLFGHIPPHLRVARTRLLATGPTSWRLIFRPVGRRPPAPSPHVCGPCGEVEGVRLFTPERLREATAPSMSRVDEVFGMPTSWPWGTAWAPSGPGGPETACGVGGVGGSFAYADRATRMAFALTKNRLTPDFSAASSP